MDFEKLKQELDKPEYDGKTDSEIADLLNNKQVEVIRPVTYWDVKFLAIQQSSWRSAVLRSQDTKDVPKGSSIDFLAVFDCCPTEFAVVDLSLVFFDILFEELISDGVMAQNHVDGLLALSASEKPFTETIGLPKIGPHHVKEAREAKAVFDGEIGSDIDTEVILG